MCSEKATTLTEARSACLNWLAQREQGRAELAEKLKSKGFDGETIRQVLDELETDGLQSDARYLHSFVRGKYAKGQGPLRIRKELRFKGVAGDGLEECLAEYDWDEAMLKAHNKKFDEDEPVCPKEYAARVRFLLQRGFELERIQALLRRLSRGDD